MTREIEYRAYLKPKGEIRDVVDIYFGKSGDIQSVRLLADHDGMSYPSDDIYVDDFILMQYTGLKDKQGVKIYEGDVVRSASAIGFVNFVSGSFVINWSIHSVAGSEVSGSGVIPVLGSLEVIGNIYEDKE